MTADIERMYAEARAVLDACKHPVPPGYGEMTGVTHPVCCACSNRYNALWRAARKAELALRPRCEAQGCRRAGTWTVGYSGQEARLCGHHKAKVLGASGTSGIFGAPCPGREGLLKRANQ